MFYLHFATGQRVVIHPTNYEKNAHNLLGQFIVVTFHDCCAFFLGYHGAEFFNVVDGVTNGFLVRLALREELIDFSFVEVRANDHWVCLDGSKELIAKVFRESFEVRVRRRILRLFLKFEVKLGRLSSRLFLPQA